MIDVRSHLPAEGGQLCELVGGPYDKMGIRFDLDQIPKEIMFDGHRYVGEMVCFDPDDPGNFDITFRYQQLPAPEPSVCIPDDRLFTICEGHSAFDVITKEEFYHLRNCEKCHAKYLKVRKWGNYD